VRKQPVADFDFQAHKWGVSESHHRTCQCGAVYNRTEAMAPSREIASFDCSVCGATMESWNTAWVPTYRLIAGPVRLPPTTN
jgi:predicted SprT family Zn-dependent metalloprotease